jgi:hypothetical protein
MRLCWVPIGCDIRVGVVAFRGTLSAMRCFSNDGKSKPLVTLIVCQYARNCLLDTYPSQRKNASCSAWASNADFD